MLAAPPLTPPVVPPPGPPVASPPTRRPHRRTGPVTGLAAGLTVRPVGPQRPTIPSSGVIPLSALPPLDTRSRLRRLAGRVVPAVAAALTLGLLTAELLRNHVGLGDVRWPLVAAAVAVTVLAQVVAAVNVRGFCPRRPALGGLVLAQFGVCFARTMAPSALGTATIIGRHLHRRGASPVEVAGALAASQTTQAITTTAIVAGVSVSTGHDWQLPTTGLVYGALGLAAVALAAGLAAWRSARARRLVTAFLRAVADVAREARRHPLRMSIGVLAGILLTVVHVAAFALLAAAAGIQVPLPTLLLIYLGAMTAGSLIPTPGGLGAVEAALTAGLVAAGAAAAPAAVAALLARLVTVWLMALPGWFALRHLRRRHLL